jgi:hypothetical protein
MGWRDHMLRLLVRGIRTGDREDLDTEVIIRVLDKILADEEFSDRLDGMDKDSVLSEFLALYESEVSGDRL